MTARLSRSNRNTEEVCAFAPQKMLVGRRPAAAGRFAISSNNRASNWVLRLTRRRHPDPALAGEGDLAIEA
jgi:hypothetical protein